MKQKINEELIYAGYHKNEYKNFEKIFNNLNILIILKTNFFGKLKRLSFRYTFKQELSPEYLNEIQTKYTDIIQKSTYMLKISIITENYIEVKIANEELLKYINVNTINKCCKVFSSSIQSIVKKYNI